MQFMFNSKEETPENLRKLAALLINFAEQAEVSTPPVAAAAPPPPPAAPVVQDALPLPPPPPPAAVAPPAGEVSTAAPEYDAAGMQWDARIHQRTKGKKKDGTWKIQKGIDPAVVMAVTQELAARRPAAAAAVSLPPAPAPVASVAPPPPSAAPPPPAASVQPGLGITFRSLVSKIMAATKEGKLTQQQVTEIVQSAGAPSLQMLNSMAHLVPDVDAAIDAALLGA
jgi:hypothetical protein